MHKPGLYKGPSHADGGIPVLVDNALPIEVEGKEYLLCSSVFEGSDILTFTNKTNREILDELHKNGKCHFEQDKAESGDFIICKKAVDDKAKRTVSGTIREIINTMQAEHGCNVFGGSSTMEDGGELSARWAKKKKALQTLSENIRGLRNKVTRDLKNKDEKIRLTALAVYLMDSCGERVGNTESEGEGHIGITGLAKKNISISKNTVQLKYTGKSGVKHDTKISDKELAKYLKKAIKNSGNKYIFATADGFRIIPDRINRYLSEYQITAKDLRGFCSNSLLIEALSRDIPKEEKDRKKLFNKMAKKVAAKIGHGVPTMKNHYLVPELELEYVERGKLIDLKNIYSDGGEIKNGVLPILKYGDSKLTNKSESISKNHPGLLPLIEEMMSTLSESNGVGLSAPQVGHNIRLFIIAPKFGERKVFINPAIKCFGEKRTSEEGCLSIPGATIKVPRYKYVTVKYQDEAFNWHTDVFEGVKSSIIQHEYDHIEGIVIADHLSKKFGDGGNLSNDIKVQFSGQEIIGLKDFISELPEGLTDGEIEKILQLKVGEQIKLDSYNEWVKIISLPESRIQKVISTLPKYKDLTLPEAELLYEKFNNLEVLKKTDKGEYYIDVKFTEGTDKLNAIPGTEIYYSLEEKGYGYIIGDSFTARDKTFEFTHAIRDENVILNTPEYPADHQPFMQVPKGGSCCANCKFLSGDKCTNTYFTKWYGTDQLPSPVDEICSDWYQPKEEFKGGGLVNKRRRWTNKTYMHTPKRYEAPVKKEGKGCLLLNLDIPIYALRSWGDYTSKIETADIYDAPGCGIEIQPHITILFGFDDATTDVDKVLSDVKKFFDRQLLVRATGISVFENKEYDVVKIDIESEILKKLNKYLTDKYSITSIYPEYKAHCTIGYVKKGAGAKYIRAFDEPVDFMGTSVFYSHPANAEGINKKDGFLLKQLAPKTLIFADEDARLQYCKEHGDSYLINCNFDKIVRDDGIIYKFVRQNDNNELVYDLDLSIAETKLKNLVQLLK
jgi:peptide deformylase